MGFVGREREQRQQERERAGQEARRRREERGYNFIIRIRMGTLQIFPLGSTVAIPMFSQNYGIYCG
jgi:hypothetical protein